MKGIRYNEEFKSQAVRQIAQNGHSMTKVAQQLGVSAKTLSKWRREMALQRRPAVAADVQRLRKKVTELNLTLKRTAMERDVLKKAVVYFTSHAE